MTAKFRVNYMEQLLSSIVRKMEYANNDDFCYEFYKMTNDMHKLTVRSLAEVGRSGGDF